MGRYNSHWIKSLLTAARTAPTLTGAGYHLGLAMSHAINAENDDACSFILDCVQVITEMETRYMPGPRPESGLPGGWHYPGPSDYDVTGIRGGQ